MLEAFVYEIDRIGFVLAKKFLEPNLVKELLAAADSLESHFLAMKDSAPVIEGRMGFKYVLDRKTAASISSFSNPGLNLIVDDFFSAAPVFSKLVNHAPTVAAMSQIALPPLTITSAELRYRYKDSYTASHMGGLIDARSAYRYVGGHMKDSGGGGLKLRHIDLVNVRVIYALHDIPVENGPLSVVPGTHKSNSFSPYKSGDPHLEPAMIPVPMEAGDMIVFTENLRHGGFRNKLDMPRRTLHLVYSQDWAGSISPAHYNGPMRLRRETWDAFDDAQRAFFPNAEIIG